ncbi:MAG TPA: hypothetical protein VGR28_03660 [Candidatus Thermoplasmatota archaeon]|jgi:hypothetical protein|nr:hypothetical protein [Candidatus Thermoplasmatota archaeon]
MAAPLVCIDTSVVRPGKLGELKAAMAELAAFVEGREPRALAYHVFFRDDGALMTVVQVHPDAASMELHLRAAAPLFPPLGALVQLAAVDVYGAASDALLEMLRAKAVMLGAREVVVHAHHAGFTRLGAP